MADVVASIALVCVLVAYARVWVWIRRRQQEQWAIGEAVRPQIDAIRGVYSRSVFILQ